MQGDVPHEAPGRARPGPGKAAGAGPRARSRAGRGPGPARRLGHTRPKAGQGGWAGRGPGPGEAAGPDDRPGHRGSVARPGMLVCCGARGRSAALYEFL